MRGSRGLRESDRPIVDKWFRTRRAGGFNLRLSDSLRVTVQEKIAGSPDIRVGSCLVFLFAHGRGHVAIG